MPEAIPPEVTALDQSEESAMAALYRAAVGELNTEAYAKVFAKFESADGVGPGWNWAAALCTLNWMLFRKLWGAALAYTGVLVGGALLLFGIGRLVFQFSREMEQALLAGSLALAFLVPGVFGNAMFYSACRKRIEKALAANTTLPEACAMLQRDASTRRRLGVLAGLNVALIATAAGAYLAAPSLDTLNIHRVKESVSPPVAPASSALPGNAASGRITPASAQAPTASSPAAASTAPAASAASAPATATAPRPATGIASAPNSMAPASAAAAASAALPATPATSAASAPASKVIAAKPLVTRPPAAATAPTAPPAARISNTYLINVGLFADENNARNAYTKLIDAGLPAITQEVRGPRGRFQRVRVGPFETRVEADTAAEKVQGLGLEAVVFQP